MYEIGKQTEGYAMPVLDRMCLSRIHLSLGCIIDTTICTQFQTGHLCFPIASKQSQLCAVEKGMLGIILFLYSVKHLGIFCLFVSFSVHGSFGCAYVCVAHGCLLSAEAREGCRAPGTGINNCCKLLCECWGSNPSLLEEQQTPLTVQPTLWLPSVVHFKNSRKQECPSKVKYMYVYTYL